MVDYLQTNWTEKMKTNPVANRILNGKQKKPYNMAQFRFLYQLPKYGPLTLNDIFANSFRKGPFTEYEVEWMYNEGEGQKFVQDNFGIEIGDIGAAGDFLHDENTKYERLNGPPTTPRTRAREQRQAEAREQRLAEARARERGRGRGRGRGQGRGQGQGQAQAGDFFSDSLLGDPNEENPNDAIGQMAPAINPAVAEQAALESIHLEKGPSDREIARSKQAFGLGARERQARIDGGGDDIVTTDRRLGDNVNGDDIGSREKKQEVEPRDEILIAPAGTAGGSSGYWDNTYVKDYINIHHPKLRPNFVQALANIPLRIKEPSVFFSDL